MDKKKKFTYIDIFSWCGGLSLWLYNSWFWKWLFAIEKSPDAFKTLKHNLIDKRSHFDFPQWLDTKNHDINEVLKNQKLKTLKWKVDMVAWWPPCQGFSLAWKRDKDDARNNLVFSYLKFIEKIEPKIVFFENVKGFATAFKDKDGTIFLNDVLRKLKKMGYADATHKIVDFSEYWVPQSRNRVIIVATKFWKAEEFFKILEKQRESFLAKKWFLWKITLEQAISDLEKKNWVTPCIGFKSFVQWLYCSPLSAYQNFMRVNVLQQEVADSHRFPKHNEVTVAKFQTIIKEKLSSWEVRERFNTKKASTRLLVPDKPAPTLTTLPDDLIHYREPRILTVREYARIQSFPDDFEFQGKYTTWWKLRVKEVPRYTQVGNAIPPLFWEQVWNALNKLLTK